MLAQTAGPPRVKVSLPTAGDITVARIVLQVKRKRRSTQARLPLPKLRVLNAKSLPEAVSVLGGVRRLGGTNRFVAIVVVVSRKSAAATSLYRRQPQARSGVFLDPIVTAEVSRGFEARVLIVVVRANVYGRQTPQESLPRDAVALFYLFGREVPYVWRGSGLNVFFSGSAPAEMQNTPSPCQTTHLVNKQGAYEVRATCGERIAGAVWHIPEGATVESFADTLPNCRLIDPESDGSLNAFFCFPIDVAENTEIVVILVVAGNPRQVLFAVLLPGNPRFEYSVVA